MVSEKPLRWVGAAHRELAAFPDLARRRTGHNLWLVQDGDMPEDWKPVETVGPGVYELRIHSGPPAAAEYRVLYVAKFEEAIYVLHAFQKTTRKTSQHNIDVGRRRYAEMLQMRKDHARRARGA